VLVNAENASGVWSAWPMPGSLQISPESFVELTVTYSAAAKPWRQRCRRAGDG